MKTVRFFLYFACLFLFCRPAAAGQTVARILKEGRVRCGTVTFPKAYVWQGKDGDFAGMDAEICRAVASAVLGRPEAVTIVPVNNDDGFAKLVSGEADILMGGVPWSIESETLPDVLFPAVTHYSALGFLAHKDAEATSMKDYAGKKVCINTSTFLISALETYSKRYDLGLRVLKMPNLSRAKEFFYMKRCDLLFDKAEILKSDYFAKPPSGVDTDVLPEVVHTYPTGPFVSAKDREFYEIVRWTVYALIAAERKGINAQNVEDFINSDDEEIQKLVGDNTAIANKLGIPPNFPGRVIGQIGNYADVYRRSFGEKAAVSLPRTVNKLVKDGGMIDGPVF